MSLHINRFVDRLRASETRGQREISLSMNEARDLHADITKLLNTLEILRAELAQKTQESVITVEVEGGTF
jgi:hypothetical protein